MKYELMQKVYKQIGLCFYALWTAYLMVDEKVALMCLCKREDK